MCGREVACCEGLDHRGGCGLIGSGRVVAIVGVCLRKMGSAGTFNPAKIGIIHEPVITQLQFRPGDHFERRCTNFRKRLGWIRESCYGSESGGSKLIVSRAMPPAPNESNSSGSGNWTIAALIRGSAFENGHRGGTA